LQYNFFVLTLFVALEVVPPLVLEFALSVVPLLPEPVELGLIPRSVVDSVLIAII
jgi:hypothetical protein